MRGVGATWAWGIGARPMTPNGFAIKLGAVAYGGKPACSAASPVPYGGASAEDGFPVAGIWRRKPSFRTGLTSRLRRRQCAYTGAGNCNLIPTQPSPMFPFLGR